MEKAGSQIRGDDAQTRSEAARALGQARTPAKSAAAKLRNEKRKGVPLPEETRKKMSDAGKERWEKIRAERAVIAATEPPVVKETKRMGRPPKQATEALSDTTPKRPRGRPRKEIAQQALPEG